MVIFGGLELVAAGYVMHELNKDKKRPGDDKDRRDRKHDRKHHRRRDSPPHVARPHQSLRPPQSQPSRPHSAPPGYPPQWQPQPGYYPQPQWHPPQPQPQSGYAPGWQPQQSAHTPHIPGQQTQENFYPAPKQAQAQGRQPQYSPRFQPEKDASFPRAQSYQAPFPQSGVGGWPEHAQASTQEQVPSPPQLQRPPNYDGEKVSIMEVPQVRLPQQLDHPPPSPSNLPEVEPQSRQYQYPPPSPGNLPEVAPNRESQYRPTVSNVDAHYAELSGDGLAASHRQPHYRPYVPSIASTEESQFGERDDPPPAYQPYRP